MFLNVCKQTFHISQVRVSQKVKDVLMLNLKMLFSYEDFQICISVPLNLLGNLVINFFWMWSIMKVYTICSILPQIPYLGKTWFLRYWPKCFRPIRLQDFLINYISRTKWWKSLIFCMLIQIYRKKKLIEKYWVGLGRKWCGHSVLRTLKLAVCQGKTNKINWFLVCW